MLLQSLLLLFTYTTYYYYYKYNDLVKEYQLHQCSSLMLLEDDDYEEDAYVYNYCY